ncbi:MAG: DNA polymerase/3'-5' exonuclease PolX [Thioalkalispiraceae bacterium]|jgi:DNA polymerase (family 10)
MPVHNTEIANIFDKLADLLEIEDANPFRVRAYRNAARTIRGDARSMAALIKQGEDLSKLPDIGKDLAEKIRTIVETGKLPLLDEIQTRTPPALSDMMKMKGLGPKRVKTLYKKLKIESIDDLKRAARSGKIRELEGFGKKTEQMIQQRVERYTGETTRTKLIEAEDIAMTLVAYLKKSNGIKKITIAGSYRRCKETVGDLDILVTAKKNSNVIDRFVKYDEVDNVISKGTTRSTVELRTGLSVDLRVVPEVSYGAALHYFTGSKAHNIAIRRIGVKKGYKVNEYGIFKGDKRIAGKTEEEVYKKVGLPYISPELRENRGEIEAARKSQLPELITIEDIQGDLHCHSKASDGHNSLKEMAEAAANKGYQYVSINDHSKHVSVAHGLNKKRLLEQIKQIDSLNEKLENIVVLKSSEVDILDDGRLDLPDSILKELDFTVCAVHYKFNLTRKQQTERILRAMDNHNFNILAHPTGRLINEREAYRVDLEKIMQAAKERGIFLELNAYPDRLDLTDESCMLAKELGVKIAISTDAHKTSDLDFMRFGINQARRGWLEASNVINTLDLKELRKLFKRNL